MTGWRLGWLTAPAWAMPALERLAQNLFLAASTPAQHAALAAFLPATLNELEARKTELRSRRDFLLPALRERGFVIPVTPQGAFYLYADCSRFTPRQPCFRQSVARTRRYCGDARDRFWIPSRNPQLAVCLYPAPATAHRSDDAARSFSCRHKKTGPKAGFFVPEPGITWQEQREQQQVSSSVQQQVQQQRRQQQASAAGAQLPSGSSFPAPAASSSRQLQREQRLLLFCRKRSWKQPAEQPGGRNISFDFPLLTNIKTHTRDRSGTCNPADARNSNKSAKENHYLLKN